MLPIIDQTDAPLLRVRFGRDVTVAELDAHLGQIDAIVAAAPDQRIALIIDLREASLLGLELRPRLAARMRSGYPHVAGRILGVAHVVDSPLVLGAMTALWWLAPPPFPTLVTRSPDEASTWARTRLDRRPPAGEPPVRAARRAS